MFLRKNELNNPTVYIHIGLNKTGTTSLQYWLEENANKTLRKHGVLFSKTGRSSVKHDKLSNLLGCKLGKVQIDNAKCEKLRQKFVAEVEKSGCNKIIVSAETFGLSRNLENVKSFFRDFDCRIIVYFRRHDEWLELHYNHFLKTVHQPNIDMGLL